MITAKYLKSLHKFLNHLKEVLIYPDDFNKDVNVGGFSKGDLYCFKGKGYFIYIDATSTLRLSKINVVDVFKNEFELNDIQIKFYMRKLLKKEFNMKNVNIIIEC